ncbi:hypothetical protein GT347_16000 [Xylophilus rhododendri]|uniref:Virulence-associated protein E-like domain-containing protein n=1 Tax=Xylophilus rhododendri TaxID=2697032 RepID=A0A857J6L1_9BURK|nr:VapE domain-containing protein [Xylophilus rhododendri]QHI99347.1 hypothetical protein GT347_16000 [Xylophilus rhododendri]
MAEVIIPTVAEPLWDNIPASLAQRQQWLLWKFEIKPGAKKPQKIPYYVMGGRRTGDVGSDRDRQRLATLQVAQRAYAKAQWDGVGFAFLPDDGLIGVDLDGQWNDDPEGWTDRCRNIVQACGSYTEISPSGKGVHIIGSGTTTTNKSNDIGVEIFCGSQYFTFTGKLWPDAPADVQPLGEMALRRLHKTVDEAKDAHKKAKQAPPSASNAERSPRSAGQDDFAYINAQAMQGFALWVPELFPKARQYKGGYRITSKELGRDLQEDLAIHPEGIQDFGEEATYTPIDLVMKWRGLAKPAEALHWLAARLSIILPKPGGREPKAPRANDPAPAGGRGDDGGRGGAGDGGGFGEPPDDDSDLEALHAKLVTRRGFPVDCRENVLYCLTLDPRLNGLVRKNDFTGLLERSRETPWGRAAGEWDEEDDLMLGEHLLFKHGLAVKAKATLRDGVMMAARLRKYNPIVDLIKAATWDKVSRLDHWLADVFEVQQREYTALIGRCFFMGLVKRALEPGCKFDYMLIIKGEQGLQKSSAWRAIAYPWFTDNAIRIGDKDSQMAQQMAWIVESAELESLNKSESTQIKQHLSAQEDWYRPPYGSQMIKAPRHSVHVGTTNADTFLRDATGDRRFWPLEVFVVNLELLKSLLPQLLAEAYVRVSADERYWPNREEEKRLIFPEQEPFKRGDPWEEYLGEYVNAEVGATQVDIPRRDREFFPTTELFDKALQIKADKIDGSGNMDTRLGNCMKALGFKRERESTGKRRRGFTRLRQPVDSAAQPAQAAAPNQWQEPDDALPF